MGSPTRSPHTHTTTWPHCLDTLSTQLCSETHIRSHIGYRKHEATRRLTRCAMCCKPAQTARTRTRVTHTTVTTLSRCHDSAARCSATDQLQTLFSHAHARGMYKTRTGRWPINRASARNAAADDDLLCVDGLGSHNRTTRKPAQVLSGTVPMTCPSRRRAGGTPNTVLMAPTSL